MDHEHYPDDYLRDILGGARTIAVVGASPRRERPSHRVMAYLQRRGYRAIPVNPNTAGGTINGVAIGMWVTAQGNGPILSAARSAHVNTPATPGIARALPVLPRGSRISGKEGEINIGELLGAHTLDEANLVPGGFHVDGDDVLAQPGQEARLHQRRLAAARGPVEQAHGEGGVGVALLDAGLPEADTLGQPVAIAWPGEQFEEKIRVVRIKRA